MTDIETWYDAEQAFDEMLDTNYPVIEIGYLIFSPSEVLFKCDPVAYRTGLLDWLDAEGIDTDELEGFPSC